MMERAEEGSMKGIPAQASTGVLPAMLLALVLVMPLPVQAIPPVDQEVESTAVFRSSGDVDPFVPFIRAPARPDRAEARREPAAEAEEEQIFRTPLERFTLQEIRVVGIVIGGGKKLAVVVDSQGVFHDLMPGMPVGVNDGKVVDILEDHVVIIEMERDADGDRRERERILRIAGSDDRGTI